MAGTPVLAQGAGRAARAARLAAAPLRALEGQRGFLFPWAPVCLGLGIGAWFALPAEPGRAVYLALGGLVLLLAAAALRGPEALRPLALALALAAAGALLAGWRAHALAAPVLDFRFYGAIEGRVVELDRSLSDRPRLTLDRVVLEGVAPDRTPARVRVSLHGRAAADPAPTGATVILTGHLSAPQGPLEPGDFDFRRHAWFEGLGAVGYTRSPVLLLAEAEAGTALWLNRLRQRLAAAVMDRVGGDAGGYAAAVTTGDRSGLSAEANQAMRDSNLYHLVSISGMHMGMLTAFVFALICYGLAAIPPLALRLPVKKVAAAVALAAAAFYLALAGRDVATERAFVMVAVMLIAVLCDRRAISLRAVATAALVVLALRPESLLNPGFQMSFAATIALVLGFEALRGRSAAVPGRLRWALPALTLVFSSFVAGTATAPLAAAHFNRVAEYGLLANALAVPAMGILVMPGAVILAISAPLGLDQPAVWMIDAGSRWILYVGAQVAALDGAVRGVPSPPGAVVPLLAVGGLWFALWQGRARWAGLAPAALGLMLWAAADRPALLIAPDGALVGVMTAEGRALSKPSDGLAARGWRENDGWLPPGGGEGTATLPLEGGVALASLGGTEIAHVYGRGWQQALASACRPGRIVVTAQEVASAAGGCVLLDALRLRRSGAVAGRLDAGGRLHLVTAAETAGRRLWTGGGRDPSGEGSARDAPLLPPRR